MAKFQTIKNNYPSKPLLFFFCNALFEQGPPMCSIGGQVTQVDVNSRHRNITDENRETVNSYKYILEKVLKNVRSITVKHAEIPSSFYNMEEKDCTLKLGVTHRYAFQLSTD